MVCSNYFNFQAVSISIAPITGESIPHVWFVQLDNTYYVALYFWLFLGSFLSRAYESNLLANLVKVDDEKQPQTIQVLTLYLLLLISLSKNSLCSYINRNC